MTIKQLAQKLRHAADVLDDLIGIERVMINETSKTAEKIRASFKAKRTYKKRKAYTYKGKHWTQLPENRARVVKMAKRRAALKAVA